MRILLAICSWGLGHATRCLPIIKGLLKENNKVTIVSHGRSLNLVKAELNDSCKYLDLEDYPLPYSRIGYFFSIKAVALTPFIMNSIRKEHMMINKHLMKEKYDIIISDNRFGIYNKDTRSYFISHQLRFISPMRIRAFERATEFFNWHFQKRFDNILVPDFEVNSLSGDLSHNLNIFDKKKIRYIGILSSINKRDLDNDIDYFISISGPEPQRTVLERKILSQIVGLKGKVVVASGKPEQEHKSEDGNIKIFSYLDRVKQEEVMNRAKMVISRSGYTTLMELAELNKKALFIPTPGQTEQEYLSDYHNRRKTFFSVKQNKLDLYNDVIKIKMSKGYKADWKTKKSVENILKIIS